MTSCRGKRIGSSAWAQMPTLPKESRMNAAQLAGGFSRLPTSIAWAQMPTCGKVTHPHDWEKIKRIPKAQGRVPPALCLLKMAKMEPPFENRIWDPAESLPRAELEKLQIERLRDCVSRVADVPFYQEAFAEQGITAESIRGVEDIRKLPFTTKEDLRQNYPLKFAAVSRERIARIHGSSGTTGKRTFVAYTTEDLRLWANLCARFLVSGGLRPEHMVHIAFGYGLFTGGFGLHYGVERVGAAVGTGRLPATHRDKSN